MSVLVVVALAAASTLCAFGVWAAIEIARTARDVRVSLREVEQRLVPLIDKADVTVDALNAELLRADAIITQFEEAGARVSHASGTLAELVNAPGEIVSDVAGRVRRAWISRKRGPENVGGATAPRPEEDEGADSEESVPPYQTEE